jgi:hypothetical protein
LHKRIITEIEGASSININGASVMGWHKETKYVKRAAGIIVDHAGIF